MFNHWRMGTQPATANLGDMSIQHDIASSAVNRAIRCLLSGIGFVLASGCVLATPKLTKQQCNDYPFVKPHGTPTPQQIANERLELQAFGYIAEDDPYPSNFEQARRRLWQAYARDCTKSGPSDLSKSLY